MATLLPPNVWDFYLLDINAPQRQAGVLQSLASLNQATGKTMTWYLSDVGTAQFTLDGLSSAAAAVNELTTDLLVLCNGNAQYIGRVGSSQDARRRFGSSGDVQRPPTIAASMQRRIIWPDSSMPTTVTFNTSTTQAAIQAMLTRTQNENGGIFYGTVPMEFFAYSTTGPAVNITVPTATVLTDAIDQCGAFDWDVAYDLATNNLQFRYWANLRGSFDIVRNLNYPGNVGSFTRGIDTTSYANAIQGTGSGTLMALRGNPTSSPTHRFRGHVRRFVHHHPLGAAGQDVGCCRVG